MIGVRTGRTRPRWDVAGLRFERPDCRLSSRGRPAGSAQGDAGRARRRASRLFYRPSDRRGSGNTRSRNMRSRCRCSMCPAIHINSRSWLRSSSTHEPSDPPLRVVSSPKTWFRGRRAAVQRTGRGYPVARSPGEDRACRLMLRYV